MGTLAGTKAAIVKMGFSFSPVSGWWVAGRKSVTVALLQAATHAVQFPHAHTQNHIMLQHRRLLTCQHSLRAPQLRVRDVIPLPLRKLADLRACTLKVLASAPGGKMKWENRRQERMGKHWAKWNWGLCS